MRMIFDETKRKYLHKLYSIIVQYIVLSKARMHEAKVIHRERIRIFLDADWKFLTCRNFISLFKFHLFEDLFFFLFVSIIIRYYFSLIQAIRNTIRYTYKMISYVNDITWMTINFDI